jgi:hypothetical protein
MLGKLLPFRRRTKSKYADDRAVDDFTRVCREQGLELDYERDAKRIQELVEKPDFTNDDLAEIADLLGQTDPNKDRF